MSDNELRELRRELSGILSRLTGIEAKLGERCEQREADIDSLKKQVRSLEINQAKVVGAATLFSLVLSYILKGLGVER